MPSERVASSPVPLYGTRILAGSWQHPQGNETHGSSFPVDVHGQGKSKTLCPQSRPRAWVVSHATALAGGFGEVSLIPLVYGLLGPHLSPLCFPPRKTPHRDLQSFWEQRKETEQRMWGEGEGVCCLLSFCRPDGPGRFKSLPGSPEGLVNPEGHCTLPGCWCNGLVLQGLLFPLRLHLLLLQPQPGPFLCSWLTVYFYSLSSWYLFLFFFFFFFHPVPIDLQSNWRCRGVKTGIDASKPLAFVLVCVPGRVGKASGKTFPHRSLFSA